VAYLSYLGPHVSCVTPWTNENSKEFKEFVVEIGAKTVSGYRNQRESILESIPGDCSHFSELMVDCLEFFPGSRPNSGDIVTRLVTIQKEHGLECVRGMAFPLPPFCFLPPSSLTSIQRSTLSDLQQWLA
jgi:hypothetical protein